MFSPIKTIEVADHVVKIIPDDSGDHECPLASLGPDEGIRFVSFDRRSSFSRDYNEFSTPGEAVTWAKKNRYEVFDLFKYDHSMVAYSIKSFLGRAQHAEWDSCQVGYVLIKKSAFRGIKRRLEVAESWCKAMTTWCNGTYYGYVIEDADGNEVDSCWGFDDDDYCELEAVAYAKRITEKK